MEGIASGYVKYGSVARSCPTLCDPVDCSPPGSSVHRISRQEYWSGLPFSPPEHLPNPGMEATSSAFPALAGWILYTKPLGSHVKCMLS